MKSIKFFISFAIAALAVADKLQLIKDDFFKAIAASELSQRLSTNLPRVSNGINFKKMKKHWNRFELLEICYKRKRLSLKNFKSRNSTFATISMFTLFRSGRLLELMCVFNSSLLKLWNFCLLRIPVLQKKGTSLCTSSNQTI